MERKEQNNDFHIDRIDFIRELIDLKQRVSKLEAKVDMLLAQNQQLALILKYVVVPLIIILGGLVGIRIAFPQ